MNRIVSIEEVFNVQIDGRSDNTRGVSMGILGMVHALFGGATYDGYKVVTEDHVYHILIDNGQNCCEDWGYFTSNDDTKEFIGKELKDVIVSDTALNQKKVEETARYGFNEGGIQFVDFNMTDGSKLQFAVYNGHNGYYGHQIVFMKDDEPIYSNTL